MVSKKILENRWVGLRIRTAFTLQYILAVNASSGIVFSLDSVHPFYYFFYSVAVCLHLYFLSPTVWHIRVESSMYYFVYCTCSQLLVFYKSNSLPSLPYDLGSKHLPSFRQIQRQIQPHWRVSIEGSIHEDGQLHWRSFLWQTHQGILHLLLLKVEMTFWNATNFSCFDRCKNASLVKAVRLTYLVKVDHSFKTFCNKHSGGKILQSFIRKISFSPTVFL